MGYMREPIRSQLVESGLEAEYLITDIVRAEPVGDGMMRVYLASRKHRTLILQFTVVASLQDFARMAKQVLEMAADAHNLAMWDDKDDDSANH